MKAANILGVLASKGDEAKQLDVSAALLDMAAEGDVELWMRCEVVGNLRGLDAKSFPADKVLPAARQLAELVVEISTLTNKLPGAEAKKADVKPAADAVEAAGAKTNDDKSGGRKKKGDNTKKEDAKNGDPKKDDENDVPADPPVKVPAQVRKLTCEELTFCLSRVRAALTGRETLSKKVGEQASETGGLLSATIDPNTRKFIEDLVTNVDKMLRITANSTLEYANLIAELQKVRTELEQWLKTAAVAKPGGGAVGADKSKPRPPVGRGKTKGGVNATVGSE